MASGSRSSLPHLPGLDGLRGIAIIGVLLVQGGWDLFPDNGLAISAFLTLSGFLVTSTLVSEQLATGHVGLRSFWTRRARQILPTLLACLAAIVVLAPLVADANQRRQLGADVVAALAQLTNWRLLVDGTDGGGLVPSPSPSPVQHLWATAILVQIVVVYAPLVRMAQRGRRWELRPLIAAVSALFVASVALGIVASLVLGVEPRAVALLTPVRAAEFLAGSLLALGLAFRLRGLASGSWRLPGGPITPIVGTLALAAVVALWIVTPAGSTWLARGGYAAHAVLVTLVIVAAITPSGPVHGLASQLPLRKLGRLSFATYVIQWPVFVWLGTTHTGLDGNALYAYRVATAVALAWLAHRYLERPIRSGRPTSDSLPSMVTTGRATSLVMVLIVVLGTLVGLTA